MIRPPVVAGQFYPAGRRELEQQVRNFLSKADKSEQGRARAMLAPHAGYVFSGAVAAQAFAAVHIPATVVLLGPNHHGIGERAAVFDAGVWQTPLGDVEVDDVLAAQLCRNVSGFTADCNAHRFEHSLEVMLPFLQVLRPDVKIVPVMLREHSFAQLQRMGAEIAAEVDHDSTLFLASSDMSHYEPAEVARQHDMPVLDLLVQGRSEEMYSRVLTNRISMCGIFAATLMLTILDAIEDRPIHGELLEYTNSGAVNGDYSAVVGYAAAVFR